MGSVSIATSSRRGVFGLDRLLPPFFSVEEFVFPQFLSPQNAALTQPLDLFAMTFHPKFPYAMQYNLNVERELAHGIILTAGYFGTRGNHLTREGEQNPFEPALGHRYNPNLSSPLQTILTDAQSFYNSFQVSVSKRYSHNLLWQASYTLAHSVDDASVDFSVESVNDPPESQNIFDRKGNRGPSDFDIRQNFVANVAYELPGSRTSPGWLAGLGCCQPFIAAPHLLQCSLSTMPMCKGCLSMNVRTLLATLTQVAVRMGPEWVPWPAGLIQVLLPFRLRGSLAMPDEICCGGRSLRNLTQRCTKILQSVKNGSLRLEWKLITCSTIRILEFRVIHKVRFPLEATGMPSSRMRRVILPIT